MNKLKEEIESIINNKGNIVDIFKSIEKEVESRIRKRVKEKEYNSIYYFMYI
jgi:hypothetical protein